MLRCQPCRPTWPRSQQPTQLLRQRAEGEPDCDERPPWPRHGHAWGRRGSRATPLLGHADRPKRTCASAWESGTGRAAVELEKGGHGARQRDPHMRGRAVAAAATVSPPPPESQRGPVAAPRGCSARSAAAWSGVKGEWVGGSRGQEDSEWGRVGSARCSAMNSCLSAERRGVPASAAPSAVSPAAERGRAPRASFAGRRRYPCPATSSGPRRGRDPGRRLGPGHLGRTPPLPPSPEPRTGQLGNSATPRSA